MSAENFFSRWSRRKRDAAQDVVPEAVDPVAAAPAPAAPQPEAPPPTMDDVAKLDRDADYARFMRRDVDEAVKRSAMKKLFSDPHFNVMDGLDIYIDDYNKFEPLPAAMVALLEHAKPILNPPADIAQSAMAMLDARDEGGDASQPAVAPDEASELSSDQESEETEQPEALLLAESEPEANESDEPAPDQAAQAATQSPATPEDGNPIQSL
jgi:hypothetical protein